jgi:tRNA A-37 threonylcarbamoyl transferase component Bud32
MQRSGLWRYRADLIVERLPDTRTLAERLAAGERLGAAQWQRIGATIRQLHEAGVDHVDLNANNLLVAADGTVWIIDFDRCRARGGRAWRAGNLARLHRSLRKLRRRHPGFLFDDTDWRAARVRLPASGNRRLNRRPVNRRPAAST